MKILMTADKQTILTFPTYTNGKAEGEGGFLYPPTMVLFLLLPDGLALNWSVLGHQVLATAYRALGRDTDAAEAVAVEFDLRRSTSSIVISVTVLGEATGRRLSYCTGDVQARDQQRIEDRNRGDLGAPPGMPTVREYPMTDVVTVKTATELAKSFYSQLHKHGEPDLALVEAVASAVAAERAAFRAFPDNAGQRATQSARVR